MTRRGFFAGLAAAWMGRNAPMVPRSIPGNNVEAMLPSFMGSWRVVPYFETRAALANYPEAVVSETPAFLAGRRSWPNRRGYALFRIKTQWDAADDTATHYLAVMRV